MPLFFLILKIPDYDPTKTAAGAAIPAGDGSATMPADEWFSDRVAEFLSQYNGQTIGSGITPVILPSITLADLAYDGPIQAIDTTTSTAPTTLANEEFSTGGGNEEDFHHAGSLVQAVTNESVYNWTIQVDFYGSTGLHGSTATLSNSPLAMSAYAYDPLVVYWAGTNSVYLDPLSQVGGSSHLISTTVSSDFSVKVTIFDSARATEFQTFSRPELGELAIALNVGQITDQFVSVLQSATNSDEQAVLNNSNLTFNSHDISSLLVLAANTYLSSADKSESDVDNLFQTTRDYGTPMLAVASMLAQRIWKRRTLIANFHCCPRI